MRITKQNLVRRWWVTTAMAVIVAIVLAWSDGALKYQTQYGTGSLEHFSTAQQYRDVFRAWFSLHALQPWVNFGLDYLLMLFYGLAFYYSAILAREAFAPRPGHLRRILVMSAAIPIAAALLDAVEDVLEFSIMLLGLDDDWAARAHAVTDAKWVAICISLLLWTGAFWAWVQEGEQRRLKQANRP